MVLVTVGILTVADLVAYAASNTVDPNFQLALTGIGLAIIIPAWSSYYNEPAFDIVASEPGLPKNGVPRILKLQVVSKRNYVHDPRPFIRFDTTGNTAGKPKIESSGKWDASPEPRHFWEDSRAYHLDFQGWLTTVARSVDILPNKSEELAIAVKHQGDQEFYVFDAWSYQLPDWRLPDNKIGGLKSVKVNVTVTSGDVVKSKSFVIENPDGNLVNFRLREDKPQKAKKFTAPEVVFLTVAIILFAAVLTQIGLSNEEIWREDVGGAGSFVVGDIIMRWLRGRGMRVFEVPNTPKVLGLAIGFAGFFIVALAAGDVSLAASTFAKIFYGGQLSWFTIGSWSIVLSFLVGIDYIKNYRD